MSTEAKSIALSKVSTGKNRKGKKATLRRISDEIGTGTRFLISTHVNPEGDAIGSVLALGLALKGLNKEVHVLTEDPVPESLLFLPGAGGIVHEAPGGAFDIAFALDCGDRERLGKQFMKVSGVGKIINIDHHVSNTRFGEINHVDPKASSASEIVYDLLLAIPAPVTVEIAENIYTGVLTDTGSFHYSNTTPKTLSVARACLSAGVDPWRVAEQVYENQPVARLTLLSRVLQTLEFHSEGRIGCVTLTRRMFEETGATLPMAEDFINFPRSVRGVEVAILFREVNPEKFRVSFRSRRAVDVARIAGLYDGGGHVNASGCTVDGSLGDVKDKILGSVKAAL